VRAGQIAFSAEPDRQEIRVAEAAHGDQDVAIDDGRGNGVLPEAGGLPELFAGLEIVAAHLGRRRNDHLLASFKGNDDRAAPIGRAIPAGAPELAPGALVERDEVRLALLLIENEQELVAFERGPGALAEFAEHAKLAEILLPDQPAVEGVAVDTARS